jgi:CHAT domain-containing protein
MGPGLWAIKARPNFQENLLDTYLEGRELSGKGKAGEAAARWQAAAAEAQQSEIAWLGPWLLQQAAEVLASAHQWKEADDAYQRSTQQAAGIGPAIEGQLLRAWAVKYEQRGDWQNAERYNRQCVVESQKSNPDTLLTAWCLYGLGNMFRLTGGNFEKADEHLTKSLEIRRNLAPGSLAVAAAANNLGLVAQDRSDLDKAERYLNEALEIRQKQTPNSLDVAASLNNLGSVTQDRGDLDKAEEYHLRALAIKEAIAPESLDAAFTYSNLGMVAFGRGDLPKAEGYMHRSLEIRRKFSPDSPDIAENLGNLGTVRWRSGDLTAAERYYQDALAVQEKFAPAGLEIANTLDNLGNLALSRQDFERARAYHDRALRIRMKVAAFSLDTSNSLDNLGHLALEEGKLDEAATYFLRALRMQEKLAPNSPTLAASLGNLGDVARRRGHLATAEKYYIQALAIEEKVAPDSLDTAQLLKSRGDVALSSNNLALAQELYQQALAIQERLAPESTDYAESLAALASIQRVQQPGPAARLFERALDALETQTTRLGGSQNLRSEFRARYSDYYKDYIDLLVQQKRAEEAFHVAERWRARSLLETLTAARVEIHHDADPELLQRERSLQASMNGKRDRRVLLLTGQHTPEQVEAVEKEIKELNAEYDRVENKIRADNPAYAALTQPQPLTLSEIQRLLEHDSLLLEYSLGKKRSYLWAVTSTTFAVHELPSRAMIQAAARRLYQQVSTRNDTAKKAGRAGDQRQVRLNRAAAVMSRMVLGPVAKQLGERQLVIVADGALQYTPFVFLPQPGKPGGAPLFLTHEITSAPSASVVAELRRESSGRKEAPKAVAVLADPVFDMTDSRVTSLNRNRRQRATARGTTDRHLLTQSLMRSAAEIGLMHLSRLPFSRREADAIMAVTPAGQGLEAVGFDASRSTATGPDLAQYRIVHFATHALSDNRHPEFSGLVLSLVNKEGVSQNGFLDLQDIYNLNLPADLVVLSGCETALGEEIQGEGIIGLTRGFMYAGATRVMASLWKVDDASTKMLMEKFYRTMEQEGMRPAAALRTAQIAMWKQSTWRDPFYWAAFEIQGEWK